MIIVEFKENSSSLLFKYRANKSSNNALISFELSLADIRAKEAPIFCAYSLPFSGETSSS